MSGRERNKINHVKDTMREQKSRSDGGKRAK